jgi:hypothetical protein
VNQPTLSRWLREADKLHTVKRRPQDESSSWSRKLYGQWSAQSMSRARGSTPGRCNWREPPIPCDFICTPCWRGCSVGCPGNPRKLSCNDCFEWAIVRHGIAFRRAREFCAARRPTDVRVDGHVARLVGRVVGNELVIPINGIRY